MTAKERAESLLRLTRHHASESTRHALAASVALEGGHNDEAMRLLHLGQLDQALAEEYQRQAREMVDLYTIGSGIK